MAMGEIDSFPCMGKLLLFSVNNVCRYLDVIMLFREYIKLGLLSLEKKNAATVGHIPPLTLSYGTLYNISFSCG
jgi:hypothetical protein